MADLIDFYFEDPDPHHIYVNPEQCSIEMKYYADTDEWEVSIYSHGKSLSFGNTEYEIWPKVQQLLRVTGIPEDRIPNASC